VLTQRLAEVCLDSASAYHALRELTTTGEQMRISEPLARWLRQMPQCQVHNHYGPSETHVVTAHTLDGSPNTWTARPPIGRPIANTHVHLLDHAFQPVPVGVTGELYIGGFNLARGYVNRPAATAAAFVPNPFSGQPGARLYKTGDLARYLPDGTIEYLGRGDHQVKIRGHRVEPGEVEAILRQHPAVRSSIVIARQAGQSLYADSSDWQLVAYVVLDEQTAPGAGDLRRYLQDCLPDYMLPAVFVFLDDMPLTLNGKVDMQKLPNPPGGRTAEEEYIPPHTPTEEQLAAIWGELLSLEQVGREDNFFLLGGHSLLATQLISRVRDVFAVDIPLHVIFEQPVIAEFAATIDALVWTAQHHQRQNTDPEEREEIEL
jgi:acyl-CoA synthetase (AMP-forming)/AMP-acid ligase II